MFPLQTLSNLLAALREGDFSIRARGAAHDDALGEAMLEVNFLGQILREQRLGALERMGHRGLLHAVGRIELVHAAPDVDQALRLEEEVFVGRSASNAGKKQRQDCCL